MEQLTATCKSVVIAAAVLHGRLTPQEAFQASRLEENAQIEEWGMVRGLAQGFYAGRGMVRGLAQGCYAGRGVVGGLKLLMHGMCCLYVVWLVILGDYQIDAGACICVSMYMRVQRI